jgi:hypothetical protein
MTKDSFNSLPLSDRTRSVLQDVGRKAGGASLGSLRVVEAILWEGTGVAARVLSDAGISIDAIERELVKAPEHAPHGNSGSRAEELIDMQLLLATASREAEMLKSRCICTEHLLLAMLRLEDKPLLRVLSRAGLEPEVIRSRVDACIRPAPGDRLKNPSLQRGRVAAWEIGRAIRLAKSLDDLFSETLPKLVFLLGASEVAFWEVPAGRPPVVRGWYTASGPPQCLDQGTAPAQSSQVAAAGGLRDACVVMRQQPDASPCPRALLFSRVTDQWIIECILDLKTAEFDVRLCELVVSKCAKMLRKVAATFSQSPLLAPSK